MNHDVFDTLIAVYAVGALDGEELAALEAHLAEGCSRCAAVLRESHEALSALAREAPRTVPPAEVGAALLRRVRADAYGRRASKPGWLRWAVGMAAASVAAAALSAAFVAGRYEARLGQMARETARVRERLQRGEMAITLYGDVMSLLRDPSTRVVALHGVEPGPVASGRVIWNARSGGGMIVVNLPPPPLGKTYELWAIAAGRPRAAGVFGVDASGTGTHRIAPDPVAPAVETFAVTLEPAGGVPAPTGPMVLASK